MSTSSQTFNAPAGLKTVVVLGASYGGHRAAKVLAGGLPDGWRVVVIDRNSHANHVYNLPRYAVLPGHEHKAFIPYDNIFSISPSSPPKAGHIRLHAHITSLGPHSVGLSRSFPEYGIEEPLLHFDYAIYALGSHLPSPINLWSANPDADFEKHGTPKSISPSYQGTKPEGICWLQRHQKRVKEASSVLIVGGGALGIQFASDIAAVYPNKQVTLIHSRRRLLPKFDESIHTEILQCFEELNVEVVLGERLDLQSVHEGKTNEAGQRVVRTTTGRQVPADLILLCTGQVPNTGLLAEMDPRAVIPDSGLAPVLRTMQLNVPLSNDSSTCEQGSLYPHIFVVGDAADAFGAINAGHNAYYQAEVAAHNVLKMISNQDSSLDEELGWYTPGQPRIKVSVGLAKTVFQVDDVVGTKSDGMDDLNASAMWSFLGMKVVGEEDMFA
ncbi:hypothetical protein SERLA73DRAFT_92683 [Serpula lacrymans var. lacrymans S7.3]|uniref:FAD/NAD(P)-binding domain-containing protein n=1 Tax=Serpula lacrymans var. lacrymans (strain S7.3) TaxID=936435 RepID=F8Q2Y1_SERL3|nr:hypothetical protein SERLA73DRAFT_92683 [Serpula lacrymans var. lacrymans S7.3]